MESHIIMQLDCDTFMTIIESLKLSMNLDTTSFMRWLGTIFTLIGVILVNIPSLDATWWVFALMALGNVFWAYVAVKIKEHSLLILNISFICIDLYGTFVRW
jgi:drug/metabolite transporter (DMT)-like permease